MLAESHKRATQSKRLGSIEALTAVAEFLQTLHAPTEYQHLFVDIALALQDAEGGVLDPLLAVELSNNRPPGAQRTWNIKQEVAALFDFLCDATRRRGKLSKINNTRIAREVAMRLPSLPLAIASREAHDPAATIRTWHRLFKRGEVPKMALGQFEASLQSLHALERASRIADVFDCGSSDRYLQHKLGQRFEALERRIKIHGRTLKRK
jgi:hypothetical protein